MSNRLKLPIILLVGLPALLGWSEYERHQGVRRVLTPRELEADLRERFNLGEVSLNEESSGHFTGSGKGRGGVYEFDIGQTPTERRLDANWKGHNSSGGTGAWTGYHDRWHIHIAIGLMYAAVVGVYAKRWLLLLIASRRLGRCPSLRTPSPLG